MALPRFANDLDRLAEDMLEMKMALSEWKVATKQTILHNLRTGVDGEQLIVAHLAALRQLRVQLHEYEMLILDTKFPQESGLNSVYVDLSTLIAEQGQLCDWRQEYLASAPREIQLMGGPSYFPDMVCEKTSEVPFAQWAADPATSQYRDLTATSVTYRGIKFQSGDMLIVDEARPVAGFMPALLSPRQITNHFLIFAIEPYHNRDGTIRYIPVVYDFADTFRKIPLNLFLSDRFIMNAFVLRHREMTTKKAAQAHEVVEGYYKVKPPFNMEAQDGGDISVGLTCGTFVLGFLEKLELALPTERSRMVGDLLQQSLKNIKFNLDKIFSPLNLLQSPELNLKGVVDNGYFGTVLTRSLINMHFSRFMHTGVLTPEKLPRSYWNMVPTIGRMQKRGPVGALARSVFARDHTAATFPRGAPEALASYRWQFSFLRKFEAAAIEAHNCAYALTRESATTPFSLHAFEQERGPLQEMIRKKMRVERKYFSTP